MTPRRAEGGIVKKKWIDLPQREMGAWLGEYILAGLALKFYAKHKRFPARIRSDLKTRGLRDGGLSISAELE